jgi:glucosamine--fructose-6-phosphate aminotransferase (isomerizing)
MCGIIGGVAQRNVTPILIEGLKRLEYRGYDSAGIAVLDQKSKENKKAVIRRLRMPGKVAHLAHQLQKDTSIQGYLGVAHTRWATHGKPSEANAHPHMSGDSLALVHNGIIENHEELRQELEAKGYSFSSQTDSEVIAHLVQEQLEQGNNLLASVQAVLKKLHGLYALAAVCAQEPDTLVVARKGSPLIIGVGIGEYFIASDMLALLPVTETIVLLQEGDVASLSTNGYQIWDQAGELVLREPRQAHMSAKTAERGSFRHFMQKEIFEQPQALLNSMSDRLGDKRIVDAIFGSKAAEIFASVQQIEIVACGTSYHAGLIGEQWIEQLSGLPTRVSMASEFRGRTQLIRPGTLMLTISQSGETADTLAALRGIDQNTYCGSLSICNVPESSLVRNSELAFLTCAGPEIGVASTKAFTTQLLGLFLLALVLGKHKGLSLQEEKTYIQALKQLPGVVEQILNLDEPIRSMAAYFEDKAHAIYLGRGLLYPIALEGALKLKEISYIHAQGYASGELKHGPLALVDKEIPVVFSIANDALLPKAKANLEEVEARGGELFIFVDQGVKLSQKTHRHIIEVPTLLPILAPLLHAIPLQLLSYHVAVLKGTDVDQPRNLAKSVTVE